MPRPVIAVTERDRRLVRTAWSLGWVTSRQLAALVTPGTQPDTLARRLGDLVHAGYLARHRLAGRDGHLHLYRTGPRASRVDPAYGQAWRPPLLQLDHTLAVNDTIAALAVPGRIAPIKIAGWQGEPELRGWIQAGQPIPDARLGWTCEGQGGTWLLEVDRGTESRHHWRRKLARYLAHPTDDVVLVVARGDARARNIATGAADLGVPLLAFSADALSGTGQLVAYDSRSRRVREFTGCLVDPW